MSTVADQPKSKSLRFVIIGIVCLSVVFAVGLCLLIFYMVRPRGDRVGTTSLTEPSAELAVNGKPGDVLVFRVDANLRVPRLSLLTDPQLEQQASRQLSKSMLTVRAVSASGSERTATCAVYKGRAASTTSTSGAFARAGMLNDCTIQLDQAGAWKVRGSVVWQPEVVLNSAALETRLEAAP